VLQGLRLRRRRDVLELLIRAVDGRSDLDHVTVEGYVVSSLIGLTHCIATNDKRADSVKAMDLSWRIKIQEGLSAVSQRTRKRLRSLSPRKSTAPA
jgi:hypothetical protein